MQKVNPKIEASWLRVLKEEFDKPYFLQIKQFLLAEKQAGKVIYPKGKDIFNAFNWTPFDEVKVVMLGQDPYHGAGQAHGLCFSVPEGVRVPPSLRNIYKEINRDLGIPVPTSGNLERWAKQGVFMPNAILTVQAGSAASHSRIGWKTFTDAVISKLSEEREGIIFMLWGNFAKGKAALIDPQKHHVLTAVHPSPLAGNRFQGCGHFSKANELLEAQGKGAIDWRVVDC